MEGKSFAQKGVRGIVLLGGLDCWFRREKEKTIKCVCV